MDPEGRICELDINNRNAVMIYMTPEVRAMHLREQMEHNKKGLDQMLWNQPMLYELSQKEPTLRITRKKIGGTTLEIFLRDCFNEAEQQEYKDKPSMGFSLAAFRLGFMQAQRHKYLYILSREAHREKVA
ncbi:hypothetical protein FKW77_000880 [Venturia effusa]|uniref:Uncharacterized protein n=1 Tax=Venturia effusa TaxID=50376 RepID=A0A517LN96_9PEZI|nr:hypothetical protein FKW77_000880 [Venturia effusa]